MRIFRNLMLFASIAVLAAYVILSEGIRNVVAVFGMLDRADLALALAVTFASIAVGALERHLLRRKYQACSYAESLYVTCYCFAPSNLIPAILHVGFATETAILRNMGMKVSDGASMMLYRQTMDFIGVTLFNFVAVMASWGYFADHASALLMALFFVGLAVDMLTSLFYAFVGTWTKQLDASAAFLIRAGARLRIVKHPDKAAASASESLASLARQMRHLPFNAIDSIMKTALSVLRLALSYAASFFIARALGAGASAGALEIIAACSFVNTVSAVMPLPGGLGIADAAYYSILAGVIGDKMNFMMLLWRIITFYVPAIISIILMSFPMPSKWKRVVSSEGFVHAEENILDTSEIRPGN